MNLQNRWSNSFQNVAGKSTGKKNRGSEKAPYLKSSFSNLISFNQPITYSMFLVSLLAAIITEERALKT